MLRKVKKIWGYFKILWDDEDFDWIFFLVLTRHKLTRMEKLFREHGCHVGSDKEAMRIKRCILVIDRLVGDDYILNHMDGMFKHKWHEKVDRSQKQDLAYLFGTLQKFLLHWWN